MAKKKNFWEKVQDAASRAYDQVNPFDGGKDWNTRVAPPKPAPAPRPAPQPQGFGASPFVNPVRSSPFTNPAAPQITMPTAPVTVTVAPPKPYPPQGFGAAPFLNPVKSHPIITAPAARPRTPEPTPQPTQQPAPGAAPSTTPVTPLPAPAPRTGMASNIELNNPRSNPTINGLKASDTPPAPTYKSKEEPGFVDDLTGHFRELGETYAYAFSPAVRRAEEARQANAQANTDTIVAIGERLKNPNLTTEEREKWRNMLKAASEEGDKLYRKNTEANQEMLDSADPVKLAANTLMAGLDLGTLGIGGKAAAGARAVGAKAYRTFIRTASKELSEQAVKQGAEEAAKRATIKALVKQGVEPAITNALSESLLPVRREGSEAKPADIITSGVVGGVFGGATPGGIYYIGKGAIKSFDAGIRQFATEPAMEALGAVEKRIKAAGDVLFSQERKLAAETDPKKIAELEADIAAREKHIQEIESQMNQTKGKVAGDIIARGAVKVGTPTYAIYRAMAGDFNPADASTLAMMPGYMAYKGSAGFEAAQKAGLVFDTPNGLAYEGSDRLLKLKNIGNATSSRDATIGDLIDHPTLFKDYPWLAKMPARLVSMRGGSLGAFYPGTKQIEINSRSSVAQRLSTLMHEVQHLIDDNAGGIPGASPSGSYLNDVVSKRLARDVKAGKLRDVRAYNDMVRQEARLAARIAQGTTDTGAPMTKTAMNKLTKELTTLQDTMRKERLKKTPSEARSNYRFSAYQDVFGEKLARTIQNRLGLTDAERKKLPIMRDIDGGLSNAIWRKSNDPFGTTPAEERDLSKFAKGTIKKDAPKGTSGNPTIHPSVRPKGSPKRPGPAVAPTGGGDVVTTQPILSQKYDSVAIDNGMMVQLAKALVDKDQPIINLLAKFDRIAKKGNISRLDMFMYNTGRLSRSNAIALDKMLHNKNLRNALEGLTKKELADFNDYAAARAELNTISTKKGAKASKEKSELVAIYDKFHNKFSGRFKSLNLYYKELAKELYDAGIIDQNRYDFFVDSDDYIRIQRNMDDLLHPSTRSGGKAYDIGSSVTKYRKRGSSREVLPADQTAFQFTQIVQREVERNRTANHLIDQLLEFGMAKHVPASKTNINYIQRIVDGKTQRFQVEKEIKEVVENLRPYELGAWGTIISAPARTLRAGTTALSLPFAAKNFPRDQVSSALNSKNARATMHPKNIFEGLYRATKNQITGTETDEMWRRFIETGGDTTTFDLSRNVRSSRSLSRQLRHGQKGRLWDGVVHPLSSLEDMISITEKATRFQNYRGIYNDAIKMGATKDEAHIQATVAAWQNSVDFNRAGTIGRGINLLVPYFNAATQGSRQLVRTAKRSPTAFAAKTVGMVGVPLTLLTMYNLQDEEMAEVYNNINEYEKDNNFIFILPGTTNADQNPDGSYTVVKIPMAQGYKDLVMPLRRAVEAHYNRQPADIPAMLADWVQSVAGPLQFESPEKALGALTPQAIKPLVHQVANKDLFSGSQVIPDYVNEATDADGNPIPEKEKFNDYTSATAKLLGKAADYVPGVDGGVSPIRIEKYIKDTLGTGGRQLLNISDRALAGDLPFGIDLPGVIDNSEVRGKGPLHEMVTGLSQATSQVNYKAGEGATRWREVNEELDKVDKVTRDAWEALHPQRTNFRGESIDDRTIVDGGVRAGLYLRTPEAFEVDRRVDAKARARGLPGNPLFDLNDDQRQTVLSLQAQRSFDPGNDMAVKAIYNANPWLEDFDEKSSAYYDKVSENIEAAKEERKRTGKATDKDFLEAIDPSGIPRPKVTPELDRKFEAASQLTDPALKAQFYKNNPDLTEYLAQNEEYQRMKRAWLGLPQFDQFPENPRAEALEEQYFALDRAGRKAFIKANQELSDYWLAKNLYNLNRAGALAQYEGENLDEDAVKDIQSIARSLGGGYGSGGGGGGGSGGEAPVSVGSGISKPKTTAPNLSGSRKIAIKKRDRKKITVKRNKTVV